MDEVLTDEDLAGNIPKDILVTEEQERLVDAATTFASFLVSHYPQVDDGRVLRVKPVGGDDTVIKLPALTDADTSQDRLNYYVSGSLAGMLLSRASHFDRLTIDSASRITVESTVPLSPRVRKVLASFARPIGDLDFVRTDFYEDHYSQKERLTKGGGGPSFDEIPAEALPVLKRNEGQIKLMCDPVAQVGDLKAARITLDGKDYYIAEPDSMLSYKVLHLLMARENKIDSINRDFPIILDIVTDLYGSDHARQATYDLLRAYEYQSRRSHEDWVVRFRKTEGISESTKRKMTATYEPMVPQMVQEVLADERLSQPIRAFFTDLQGLDSEGVVFGKGANSTVS